MGRPKKIALIGAGNMGEALVRGLLLAKRFAPEDLIAADPSGERGAHLSKTYSISTTKDNTDAVRAGEVVILSVKPSMITSVLSDLERAVDPSQLVVSIVAGVTLSQLRSRLREARIVRGIPNISVMVGEGVSVLASDTLSAERDIEEAKGIFQSIGKVVTVEERLLDAVTGLAGSGPAYIFLVIEALADGGVKMGLPREIATLLSAQTVLGAAKMVMETGRHPALLKDLVASPGGTTIAGLHVLEEGLRALLIRAVEAATQRAEELGKIR